MNNWVTWVFTGYVLLNLAMLVYMYDYTVPFIDFYKETLADEDLNKTGKIILVVLATLGMLPILVVAVCMYLLYEIWQGIKFAFYWAFRNRNKNDN